jgi:hypothetical protein
MQTYRAIAKNLQWQETVKPEWQDRADDELANAMNQSPSGSGIDNGTILDDTSKPDKLVFSFGFHHMNEAGYYDGWTEHKAIVTPSLCDSFNLRITGRDRNQIKDYLYDVFSQWLEAS